MNRCLVSCAVLALGMACTAAMAQQGIAPSHSNQVQPANCETCAPGMQPGMSYAPSDGYVYAQDGCGLGEVGGCGVACGDSPWSFDLLGCGLSNDSRWVFGAEYMQVRARPSDAVSYLVRDLTDITSPTDTMNQFRFGYGDSYRLYAGYRLNACGEEIRFTYTRFDTGAGFTSPSVPEGSNGAIQIVSPLEVIGVLDGSYTQGRADVTLDSFDIGWSKTIPLGSPLACDPCGDCAGGCVDACGGGCPAWDITFTGALRTADLSAGRQYASFTEEGQPLTRGDTEFDFDGVGGRFGVMSRRYFGAQGIFSMYAKGDISVLVGDYETRQRRSSFATPNQVTSQTTSTTNVVPVTEFEAGGTLFLTGNTSLSSGYFVSAWHDLGFRDEYEFGLQSTYDDANIMGFDGWFLRLETLF